MIINTNKNKLNKKKFRLLKFAITFVVILTMIANVVLAIPTTFSNQKQISNSVILSETDAINAYKSIEPNAVVKNIRQKSTLSNSYYELESSQILSTNSGEISVEWTTQVNAESGEVTTTNKVIRKNTDPTVVTEGDNELIVLSNDELVTISNIENKANAEKLLVNVIEPLVKIGQIKEPKLSSKQNFIAFTKKNSGLIAKENLVSTSDYDIQVVESDNLNELTNNQYVIKVCNAEKVNLQKFSQYSKEFLKAQSQIKIRELNLQRTMFDASPIPALQQYLEDDGWYNQADQTSIYQQFVTPDDPAVLDIIKDINTPEQAYLKILQWTWVSDLKLNNIAEKWLKPNEYILKTPDYLTNPTPGIPASDCSEKANTLVSMIRALGVPPEQVRVAIGEVNFDGQIGGHAWVEIWINNGWMVLDSTSGPYYDDENKELVDRTGTSYKYWMYHEYPVNEVWAYYNDKYYYEPNSNTDIVPEWLQEYNFETFLDAGIFGALINENSLEMVFITIAVIGAVVILGILFVQSKNSKNKQK